METTELNCVAQNVFSLSGWPSRAQYHFKFLPQSPRQDDNQWMKACPHTLYFIPAEMLKDDTTF